MVLLDGSKPLPYIVTLEPAGAVFEESEVSVTDE
jgi:hypothetical protein